MFTRRSPGAYLFGLIAAYLALMVAIPLTYPYGTFTDLDGRPMMMDNGFPDMLSTMVYGFGDMFCHQEMSRCIMLNGSQTALCIRDVAIFTGLAAGLLFTTMRDMNPSTMLLLGIALTPVTGIEWGLEHLLGDLMPLRALSGVITGIGISLIAQWSVNSMYESVMR